MPARQKNLFAARLDSATRHNQMRLVGTLESAQEKPSEGEIIAVGEGARDDDGDRIPLDVKVGDRVLFGKWSGTEVKINGEDLLIMKESDIMGIIG